MLADFGPNRAVDRPHDIVMKGWTAMSVRIRTIGDRSGTAAGQEAEGGFATRQKGNELTIEDMERTDRLLTVDELAIYLGVPVATLYQWRYRREGPPGFRVGRYIRYRPTDVQQWIERQLDGVTM